MTTSWSDAGRPFNKDDYRKALRDIEARSEEPQQPHMHMVVGTRHGPRRCIECGALIFVTHGGCLPITIDEYKRLTALD